MGYCESDCQYLSSRHNCQKYHKGLAYSKCSIGGASFGATHERCSECEKDHIIKKLEDRDKPRKVLCRRERGKLGTSWLCPACEADQTEVVFIRCNPFCWQCGQRLDWNVEHKED